MSDSAPELEVLPQRHVSASIRLKGRNFSAEQRQPWILAFVRVV